MSCSKDNGDPTIKFIAGQSFTGKDTVMLVADTLPVAIEINWNGTDVIETLEAYCRELRCRHEKQQTTKEQQ